MRCGLATEGSRSLIDKAFGEFGAARVYATTMAVNANARDEWQADRTVTW